MYTVHVHVFIYMYTVHFSLFPMNILQYFTPYTAYSTYNEISYFEIPIILK